MTTQTAGQKTPEGLTCRKLPTVPSSYTVFLEDKHVSGSIRELIESDQQKAIKWVETCHSIREYPYTFDKMDYMWDGMMACLYNLSGPNILHEVAHWLLASEDQRKLIDFGIGYGPESAFVPHNSKHRGYESIAAQQESFASVLGIAIQYAIGIPARETMQSHSWAYISHGAENNNAEEFRHYYSRSLPILESIGFVVRSSEQV